MIQSALQFIPQEKHSQKSDLLNYLISNGSITRFEAAFELGVMELSSRIGELEKDGWIVPREWKRGTARNGRAYCVMKYLRPHRQ